MHMTRHRAKSSFTVEIKRANRRAPEVTTVAKAVLGHELIDRVFGRIGAPAEKSRTVAHPRETGMGHSPVPLTPSAYGGDSTCLRPPEPPLRRVLPDLLARGVDPVEQRMKQEVEERAARRSAMPQSRRVRIAAASTTEPQPEASIAVPLGDMAQQIIAPVLEEPVTAVEAAGIEATEARTSAKPKRKARLDTIKARRTGLPPLFAAGERWKRRLPKACW